MRAKLQRHRLTVVQRIDPPHAHCDCHLWGMGTGLKRQLLLDGFMEWAWAFCGVRLKLLARGDHIVVAELLALRPGYGKARKVMTALCAWTDCARATMELTASDHWGSNVERLHRFYASFGFVANTEPKQSFVIQEELIRYPVRSGHHGA